MTGQRITSADRVRAHDHAPATTRPVNAMHLADATVQLTAWCFRYRVGLNVRQRKSGRAGVVVAHEHQGAYVGWGYVTFPILLVCFAGVGERYVDETEVVAG